MENQREDNGIQAQKEAWKEQKYLELLKQFFKAERLP
jgi:hypothetical protein